MNPIPPFSLHYFITHGPWRWNCGSSDGLFMGGGGLYCTDHGSCADNALLFLLKIKLKVKPIMGQWLNMESKYLCLMGPNEFNGEFNVMN